MAFGESAPVFDQDFSSHSDNHAKQFQIMKFLSTADVDPCAAATDRAIGILQNKPTAGQAASIRILGISRVAVDGSGTSIAAGDYIGSNSSGLGVKKATADYTAIGIALAASTAATDIIPVLLMPGLWFRTAAG